MTEVKCERHFIVFVSGIYWIIFNLFFATGLTAKKMIYTDGSGGFLS